MLRIAGEKAQKMAQVAPAMAPATTNFGMHYSFFGQTLPLRERMPLAPLPMAMASPMPLSLQVAAAPIPMGGGGSHMELGQLATRAVREQRAQPPVIARVVCARP